MQKFLIANRFVVRNQKLLHILLVMNFVGKYKLYRQICAKFEGFTMIYTDDSHFKDEHGRTLMLRGVNLGGSSKVPFAPNGATSILDGFFDHRQVVQEYYPECADLVKRATNAAHVSAFDHNIRSTAGKDSRERVAGGQEVQRPIHVVHGDYTLVSAPQRLHALASPPGVNDTLRAVLDEDESLLSSNVVSRTLDEGKRFALINVWRNIDHSAVMSDPLALCDGT